MEIQHVPTNVQRETKKTVSFGGGMSTKQNKKAHFDNIMWVSIVCAEKERKKDTNGQWCASNLDEHFHDEMGKK